MSLDWILTQTSTIHCWKWSATSWKHKADNSVLHYKIICQVLFIRSYRQCEGTFALQRSYTHTQRHNNKRTFALSMSKSCTSSFHHVQCPPQLLAPMVKKIKKGYTKFTFWYISHIAYGIFFYNPSFNWRTFVLKKTNHSLPKPRVPQLLAWPSFSFQTEPW